MQLQNSQREGEGGQLALISGNWVSVLNKGYRTEACLNLTELAQATV